MYTYTGAYNDLHPLLEQVDKLTLELTGTGYGSTGSQQEHVRSLYFPLLGHIFTGAWAYAMVVSVLPGGSLPAHCDGVLPPGFTRYHLVLQTNPRAWNYHDGTWQRLTPGGIYTLDPTLEHGAINWGEKPRIQLAIDMRPEDLSL